MHSSLTFSLVAGLWFGTLAMAQGPGGGPAGGGQQGDGIWRRNAYYGEFQTFDACVGHQPGTGQYHYHANPTCLRYELGDNIILVHTARTGNVYQEKTAGWTSSPILGWALDGYPIYGPYGYSDPTNASSPIKRLASSFQMRSITTRTSLPTWVLPDHTGVSQQLTSSQYGPAVSTTYPLGRYVEDYEYIAGLGDLDQYNGRFEVTPEFPSGTYCYHVTIDDTGTPTFPYVFAAQFYGEASGGMVSSIPSSAQTYTGGLTSPSLSAWVTSGASQDGMVVSGYDPSAGASTTWPSNIPNGAEYMGGASSPVQADIQKLQYTSSAVYVNANGIADYTMGPWFDPTMTGGVFSNFPSNQEYQFMFPAAPAQATTQTVVSMGPQGLWVNGVTVFNFLDGASYSNENVEDQGGGSVFPTAAEVSSASFESGPAAPGSLVSGFSIFGAQLAASTVGASSTNWPTTLGTTSVSVKDSAGVSRAALVSFVSPGQVNFQVPGASATGFATVTYSVGMSTITSNMNILSSYENIFETSNAGAVGYVIAVNNGQQIMGSLSTPIVLNPAGSVYLILFGSGLGTATSATATIKGVSATVTYAGPQGTYSGLDQFNIEIPNSLAGSGTVPVIITTAGRPSNTVTITIQ